ncbi:hypothetical protein EHI47_07240 [Rhizobium leguminosarum]|uniref:Uncharacterized protein n=1 Tax=Rhizobium leguminosarum TaxID=384 RepID=A0A444I763_RHILE|nr:hypothetical protein EHI47_07240 [Rhizobium leguminosarum]
MIAAWIAGIELEPDLQYSIPLHPVDTGLMLWAVLIGAPFGAAGYAFAQWTSKCALKAAKGSSRIWKSILSFCHSRRPIDDASAALDNGKGPAELAFSDDPPIGLAATLIVAKILCVTVVLRLGAKGGLLTPGFALPWPCSGRRSRAAF